MSHRANNPFIPQYGKARLPPTPPMSLGRDLPNDLPGPSLGQVTPAHSPPHIQADVFHFLHDEDSRHKPRGPPRGLPDADVQIGEFLQGFGIPTDDLFEYATVNRVSVVEALKIACASLRPAGLGRNNISVDPVQGYLAPSNSYDAGPSRAVGKSSNFNDRGNRNMNMGDDVASGIQAGIHAKEKTPDQELIEALGDQLRLDDLLNFQSDVKDEGDNHFEPDQGNQDWDASFALLVELAEAEGGMEYQFKALADLGVLDEGEMAARECSVCFEYKPLEEMLRLPCEKHHLCSSVDCLEASIFHSIKSRIIFTCCNQPLTPVLLTASLVASSITPHILSTYTLLYEELTTPIPLYCASLLPNNAGSCSTFIPSLHIAHNSGTDIGRCTKCGQHTCATCKHTVPDANKHTREECQGNRESEKKKAEEADMKVFEAAAKKENWKKCPKEGCGRWVEKISGCSSVVCTCQGRMCWICGGAWKTPGNYSHLRCGNEGCASNNGGGHYL